jgi:DNA-binding MarR family transcriptional regulator
LTASKSESGLRKDALATMGAEIADRHVGRVCHMAVDGRRSARALGQWCERFALSEPEFQVLWCLRDGLIGGFDQTTLAKLLAFSAAQVSATVEKLRARGWIAQHAVGGDRRRNLWHLSVEGGDVIIEMLRVAHELSIEPQLLVGQMATVVSEREAAA